jgi:hypothetical protein
MPWVTVLLVVLNAIIGTLEHDAYYIAWAGLLLVGLRR